MPFYPQPSKQPQEMQTDDIAACGCALQNPGVLREALASLVTEVVVVFGAGPEAGTSENRQRVLHVP